MPAYDNMFHFQMIYRIFQNTKNIWIGIHHHIRNIAMNKDFPGCVPVISFAGTRLSLQPIHKNSGVWICDNLSKYSGSTATLAGGPLPVFL
jgi:hypothetical protein